MHAHLVCVFIIIIFYDSLVCHTSTMRLHVNFYGGTKFNLLDGKKIYLKINDRSLQ